LLTAFLVGGIHLDAVSRRGSQRVFAPSPPLLPARVEPTVDALLLVPLALIGLSFWRTPQRWAYLPALLALTFLCVVLTGGRLGL
jgi:hypothetical protein